MSIIGLTIYWSASVDPTITNYKIYCGTSSGSYTDPNSPMTVGNVLNATYLVPAAGLYYFAISAISSVTGETVKGTEFTVMALEPVSVVRGVIRRQSY